jgi:hypothetical protein
MIGRLVIDDFFDPVPLHRSILFWLGLFVLSFLLWSWADSRRHFTNWIHMPSSEHALSLGTAESALLFGSFTTLPAAKPSWFSIPPPPAYPTYQRIPLPASRPNPWFCSPRWDVSEQTSDRGGVIGLDGGSVSKRLFIRSPLRIVSLSLPYWLLITLYLPAWLGASAWRARRIAKHRTALLTPAQPQTDL